MLATRFRLLIAGLAPLAMLAEHFNHVRVKSSNPRRVSTPPAGATPIVILEYICCWVWNGGKG
jgi:hypothetical protein